MTRFRYTLEHKSFLKSGFKKYRIPELTAVFNDKFDLKKSESEIRACIKGNKFKSGRKAGLATGERSSYTTEMIGFLKENYPKMGRQELTKAFNDSFNFNKSVSAVIGVCKKHKIKSGRDGRFEKGHIPSPKCYPTKPNSGSFKKGQIPWNKKPIGHERVTKGGALLVKVDEPNVFRLKSRVEWEKHFGEIPEGMVVVCRDGDSANCSPENLTLMTRSELIYLNQSGHKEADSEVKPVLRTLARIQSKQTRLKRESKE